MVAGTPSNPVPDSKDKRQRKDNGCNDQGFAHNFLLVNVAEYAIVRTFVNVLVIQGALLFRDGASPIVTSGNQRRTICGRLGIGRLEIG
jgi:hypothetical protein